jgi:hypothetical protein
MAHWRDKERYANDPVFRARVLQRNEESRIRTTYGLEPAEYYAMLDAVGHVCELCGQAPGGRKLCIDHDHENGKIRGMLCTPCNSALSRFGDTTEAIDKLRAYTERTK